MSTFLPPPDYSATAFPQANLATELRNTNRLLRNNNLLLSDLVYSINRSSYNFNTFPTGGSSTPYPTARLAFSPRRAAPQRPPAPAPLIQLHPPGPPGIENPATRLAHQVITHSPHTPVHTPVRTPAYPLASSLASPLPRQLDLYR